MSASRRKIAWISDALREAEKEELEEFDAIAARWAKQERRRRKRVGEGCKFVVLTAGVVFGQRHEVQSPGFDGQCVRQRPALEPIWRKRWVREKRGSMQARGVCLCAACSCAQAQRASARKH